MHQETVTQIVLNGCRVHEHWALRSAQAMLKSELEGDETLQVHLKQNLFAEPQAETFLDQSENESAGGVTHLPESRPINREGQGHSVPCTRQAHTLLCLPGLLRALPPSTSAPKLGVLWESPDWEKQEMPASRQSW